jgi:acyl carrier protein
VAKQIDCRTFVLQALAQVVPPERRHATITEQTDLRSIGIDSLGLMVLLADLCRIFGVDLESVDPSGIDVTDVADLIEAAEHIVRTSKA